MQLSFFGVLVKLSHHLFVRPNQKTHLIRPINMHKEACLNSIVTKMTTIKSSDIKGINLDNLIGQNGENFQFLAKTRLSGWVPLNPQDYWFEENDRFHRKSFQTVNRYGEVRKPNFHQNYLLCPQPMYTLKHR